MNNWYTKRKIEGRCVTWSCSNKSIDGMVRCSSCLKGRTAAVTIVEVPETTLAYFAGIVDGEGCVAIRDTKYKSKKTGEITRLFFLSVIVTNASLKLLERFKHYFGGHIAIRKKAKKHHQQTYGWHLGYRAGAAFIKRLLPYLEIKKEQAILSLRCQEMRDSRLPKEQRKVFMENQEELFNKVKELKHDVK